MGDLQRSTTIPINEDVISSILEYLDPKSTTSLLGSPKFLWGDQWVAAGCLAIAPLCLVSRMWLRPARRHLYRVITAYTTYFNCPLFLCAVSTSSTVASLVRHLHIQIAHWNVEDFNKLTEALPQCTFFVCSTERMSDTGAIKYVVDCKRISCLAIDKWIGFHRSGISVIKTGKIS
jgi:hypothetical protein